MVAVALLSRIRRGSKVGTRKAALVGAAAATAVAMAMGTAATPVAPAANALTLDTTTTGPLLWAVSALGVDSITIPNVPVVGSITLNLGWTNSEPANLNDVINAATFGPFVLGTASRPNVLASNATGPLLFASGTAVPNAIATYQALLSSAGGDTLPGFSPLVAAGKVSSITGQPCSSGITCVQGTNATNLAIGLLRNPETPNGGLYARFAPILNLFGIDPVSPDAGSASSTGIRFSAAFVNAALGYDMLSDFPETLNPFSLANSVLATVLPTYLAGGVQMQGTDLNTIENNLIALATLGTVSTTYSTLVPNDLPLLEPLRLPSRILNAAFGALGVPIKLGTPLADALQPALEILVNTGYTDVQTPSEGGTYNRTYDQSGQYVPYLSQATLTPQEWAAVPGDVVKALFTGVKDVLTGQPTTASDSEESPAAQTVSVAATPRTTKTAASANSAKPAKKSRSAASSHKSGHKASAHKGVGGSKRAAS
ncbi:PE-PPE domain-containing protein [Mycobacterium sp. CVI_P3]|uniref:PE-PPE domain-containing protein n=1 Tax=Mycobacterium pinniadriaticum TaxID=2994102 RepID=A0ABT3SHI8_9MYCO|nr:PE-PPE domain-containing protein [Mycobacterium pinniadriaticum]MCX2931839.1 PE-PPE domain-containing protein [Mycobacterium pinniadriaticum]MCX2938350.1 PE-PPE domain-containing protein [Mycobacterium pinniadriaticum]